MNPLKAVVCHRFSLECVSVKHRSRRVDKKLFVIDSSTREMKASSKRPLVWASEWVLECWAVHDDRWTIAFHTIVDWRIADHHGVSIFLVSSSKSMTNSFTLNGQYTVRVWTALKVWDGQCREVVNEHVWIERRSTKMKKKKRKRITRTTTRRSGFDMRNYFDFGY